MRREDREGALGQVGLGQHLAHDDRAERSPARRLEHERTADGERRRDLVRREVEGKIERRDEAAGADRHPFPDALIAACARADVERLDFPGDPNRFLGGDPERVDQPGDLALAVLDRLPRLDAEREGQLFGALPEAVDAMLEHGLPLIARHARHRLDRGSRGGDACVDRLRVRLGDPECDLAAIFVGNLEVGIGLLRLIGEVERVDVLQLHHGVRAVPSSVTPAKTGSRVFLRHPGEGRGLRAASRPSSSRSRPSPG